MDPIELMAIKPWQVKKALGTDCVKIVRGSRKIYNQRQIRYRRGQTTEPDGGKEFENQTEKTRPIWRCTDVACGGRRRRQQAIAQGGNTNESQTDPIDLTHYGRTDQELKQHNVTILNAYPRDIQDGVVRPKSGDKVLSIDQRGSSATAGSQLKRPKSKQRQRRRQPKTNIFQRMGNFLKGIGKRAPPTQEDLASETSSWSTSSADEENVPEERDHEWLEHTSTERSQDDMQEAFELDQIENPPSQIRIELQCYALMSSIKPLFWFLKCGGRWPLQTYVEDRLYKFRLNRRSPNFILFLLTTLLLMFCASQILVNIVILLRGTRAGGYQTQVLKVLFNKYWPFAFVTVFYALYASIWSLGAIFDDGIFLAQFMTRWNLGIAFMNYDPCENVRWDMWWSLGWLIFYFLSLSIFYIWDIIPAVRGTSELLGTLLFGGFVSDVNIGKFFFLVRIFGFLFHLYAVFSARIITILILMYCKFLENLARTWNLRFCYVFHMLGTYEGPNLYTIYHTVIPFTKLFTEHKLITAVSRHTGKVFSIALTSYTVLKGLEMIIFAYSTCCLFVFSVPVLNETALPCPLSNPDCERVPFLDEDVFAVMTLLYCTCQSWLGWYLTSDSIASCGQAIMSGIVFVRRYGFPRCRNCKERRFIQSLNFTFLSITNYYINAGFKINRKFIFAMFSWVVTFTSLIVLFSPFQLRTEVVTYCGSPVNDTTTCYRTTIPIATLYNLIDGPLTQQVLSAASAPALAQSTNPPLPPPLPIVIDVSPVPIAPTVTVMTTASPTMSTTTTEMSSSTTEMSSSTTKMSTSTTEMSSSTTEMSTSTTKMSTSKTEMSTTTTEMSTSTTEMSTLTTEMSVVPSTPKPEPPVAKECSIFPDDPTTAKLWRCDFYLCPSNRPGTTSSSKIAVPILCDNRGRIKMPYELLVPGDKKNNLHQLCYKKGVTKPSLPYAKTDKGYTICSTKKTYLKGFAGVRDDCGNLPIDPNLESLKDLTEFQKAMGITNMRLGVPLNTCYACYQYSWFSSIDDFTANMCSLPDSAQDSNCKQKLPRPIILIGIPDRYTGCELPVVG